MKRILEIGIYKPGDLTQEVTSLDDLNAHVNGDRAVFTGHATVKSRFKGQDFSGFYQLSKVYAKEQEHWQVVASRTARLAESHEKATAMALNPSPVN
jgi:ketosteroid isomerase-like protein